MQLVAAMNDPWDVKCVKRGRPYQSCMKLNGVPLLPPLLSKECRKEMEYYKLLAQEVEKRMSALHAYIRDRDQRGYSGDDADATDLQELPECQHLKAIENHPEPQAPEQEKESSENNQTPSRALDSQVFIDVNVKISEKRTTYSPQVCDDLPERDRDYNHSNEVQQDDILSDIETSRNRLIHQLMSLDIFKKANAVDQDSPSSLSVKNFTGSLNDLHGEIAKETPIQPLIRQSSYTLLTPSPQLLAHLEIQSLNTGVDVQAISMSESTNNLSPTGKKRKSWDLESAKEKWSSMALELQKNIGTKSTPGHTYAATKTTTKKPHILKVFNRSLQEKTKKVYGSSSFRKSPKSEPLQKPQNVTLKPVVKRTGSPVRKTIKSTASYVIDKEEKPPKDTAVALISESKDPAAKVRELYEKLQKQHTLQMANLIEKQKREQQVLQQVFNEQNNLLLKQLKLVCPKATIVVKEAWGEEKDDADGHPVSLSQLLHSTPVNSMPNSPASKTLTDSKSCLNKCDNVLKHSRDIINSIKKGPQAARPATVNGIKNQVPTTNRQARAHERATVTSSRTHSPSSRNASRRLNYDSSATTEDEPMLTDRTNDTMADLNVTFPSDNEEVTVSSEPPPARANSPVRGVSPRRSPSPTRRSTNSTIRNYEEAINSMKQCNLMCRTATTEERAAATKIVAYAKGYLVRRLMRTERVQATVQTIRDALLCALQLHQDREGIRGADVDLHRRLIQQITAACYTLHDTFVGCSTTDRCALIAADRSRKMALAAKPSSSRNRDIMSHSHSGVFPSRPRPKSAGQMTRSYYATETSSEQHRPRYHPARRPWR